MQTKKYGDKSGVHEAEAECTTESVKPTTDKKIQNGINSVEIEQEILHKLEFVWINVMGMVVLHLMAIYGFYLIFTSANIWTTIFAVVNGWVGGFGVAAGSHRLWSHRSFKATLPMKILLMLLDSTTNRDSIYEWARDHRIHHKYTDTNADPYNSKRGFLFSHIGWLMLKKHPDVKKYGKGIDFSDLTNDPVVAFQKKYFYIIMPMMNVILPTLIPVYFWGESLYVSFFVIMWKSMICLHTIWTVNSVAHTWGYKPYDRSSTATDNPYTVLATLGEAWHNYHHSFPWDYKVPDLPFYFVHPTAKIIEFFALFGLIYDLKTVSQDLSTRQANRSGDGTIKKLAAQADKNNNNFLHKSTVWGWDDEELKTDDRNGTEIHAKSKGD